MRFKQTSIERQEGSMSPHSLYASVYKVCRLSLQLSQQFFRIEAPLKTEAVDNHPLSIDRTQNECLNCFERVAGEMMSLCQVFSRIEGQINLFFIGFPGHSLQRKVDR